MKPYKVGIVAVAILLVVTGIGFGIAQAAGTHSERPVLSFADLESLEHGSSSGSYYVETRPVLVFELENPIETGALPATSSEESWMKEYGHD